MFTFRRIDLLDGRLRLLFLGGIPCDVGPMVFGEQFWTVIYNGVAIDPGSPKMRMSLRGHLQNLPHSEIRTVVATHHHEGHVGNLNWLADKTGADVVVAPLTAKVLSKGLELLWARRLIIGTPPRLQPPFELLRTQLQTKGGCMDVYPAGHCHDHIVLFDPREKLMIVADAFMGSIFRRQTRMSTAEAGLKRMLALDIEILIEGHGFIHTLRPDIPDIPGVVIRRDPKEQLCETLQYLKWLREQIEAGFREGLPICAIEATCFPGAEDRPGNSSSTTNSCGYSVQDTGSRTELVRSLVRRPQDDSVLPLVYQARIGRQEYRGLIRKLDRSRPLFG